MWSLTTPVVSLKNSTPAAHANLLTLQGQPLTPSFCCPVTWYQAANLVLQMFNMFAMFWIAVPVFRIAGMIGNDGRVSFLPLYKERKFV